MKARSAVPESWHAMYDFVALANTAGKHNESPTANTLSAGTWQGINGGRLESGRHQGERGIFLGRDWAGRKEKEGKTGIGSNPVQLDLLPFC